jgi:hypothetical protein
LNEIRTLSASARAPVVAKPSAATAIIVAKSLRIVASLVFPLAPRRAEARFSALYQPLRMVVDGVSPNRAR